MTVANTTSVLEENSTPLPSEGSITCSDPLPYSSSKKTAHDDNDGTIKKCKAMVASLTESQKETAARSSYRYFITSITSNTEGENQQERSPPSHADREKYAVEMARRHLLAEKGDESKALDKMKNTIRYREDVRVDDIRRCYYDKNSSNDEEKQKLYESYRNALNIQIRSGKVFIRGYDKENRAIYCVFPRRENHGETGWYVNTYCAYSLERAIACTERKTNGTGDGKIIVVFDYNGYTLKNTPRMNAVRKFLFTLQNHYPERLHAVYLVDTPAIFRAFWTAVKPFIDPVTKEKVKFVTGEEQRRLVFEDVVSAEQSMPFMRPDGKMTGSVDIEKYLDDIPFDRAADEAD